MQCRCDRERAEGATIQDPDTSIRRNQDRSYGGVSAQQRVEARRERLLAAGLDLFGTKGVAATTITDVCARAGLIRRYFYESFSGIDELASALFLQLTGRLEAEAAREMANAAGRDDPRPAVNVYVAALLGDPRIGRFLGPESRTGPLAPLQAEFATSAVSLWFSDGATPVTTRQRFNALAFAAGMAGVVVACIEGRLAFTADELVDELVDLFLRMREI